MPDLYISEGAETDLRELYESDVKIAARITVLLEELRSDEDLLDRLTQHNYGNYGKTEFHVSKWFEHWNKGRNLWRLKIYELDRYDPSHKYRIIYAFIPASQAYHVLAIAPRSFDYKEQHPITQRVVKEYAFLT